MGKNTRAIPQQSYWVKLERIGNTISMFTSPDGVSWAANGSGGFANIGKAAFIGLAVCSNANGTINTSTFSNVRITGGNGQEIAKIPTPPLAVCASLGETSVPVRWLESFGATSYRIKRGSSLTGPFQVIANVKDTEFTDKTATQGKTYFYTVSALNSAGESDNSPCDSVDLRPQLVRLSDGVTASVSSSGSNREDASRALDWDFNTKWYSGDKSGTRGWIQLDMGNGEARVVRRYDLSAGADAPERDPKDWQLQASNDGTNWTTLDTQTGQVFRGRHDTRIYPLTGNASYRFYRLNINAIADPTANAMQLAEFTLRGEAQ